MGRDQEDALQAAMTCIPGQDLSKVKAPGSEAATITSILMFLLAWTVNSLLVQC